MMDSTVDQLPDILYIASAQKFKVVHALHLCYGQKALYQNGKLYGKDYGELIKLFSYSSDLAKEFGIKLILPILDGRNVNECELINHSFVIKGDGRVCPCCRLDDMGHAIGNILSDGVAIAGKLTQKNMVSSCSFCLKYLWNYGDIAPIS
jgi:hypothetical protein